jgi:hypothetical protein
MITFGKINMKFLIPIIGGIIRLIYRFLVNINSKYEIILKNPFILSIYTSIGMVFAFIPYIILKYRSKKINLNISENKSKLNIEFVRDDVLKKTRIKKYKLILLTAIFDFSQTLLILIFCMKCIYNLWIFEILFISLFSYLLLKTKLYKHQYLSMIIIIILGLLLNIIEDYKSDKKNKFDALEIFLKFLVEIFMSLCIVIAKYNMEKNYCSPYEICIWEGLIELILYIIFLLIINKLELTIADVKYPDNFWELINNYDINDFWLCLLIVFVNAIYNLFIFLTCNYFTPCHVLIISMIHDFYFYLKINENWKLNIIGFFILLLILFMFLIFIEIIEINIFNISYNTKKNIELRAKTDSSVDNNSLIKTNEEIELEGMKILIPSDSTNEE